ELCGKKSALSRSCRWCARSGPVASAFTPAPNYGGVYVGLPSDAAAMAPSQTKAAPKGTGRLCMASLLLSGDQFVLQDACPLKINYFRQTGQP
uniref:Uncharacterized protein n=1 Tax=Catharus ustulatus TaxID=91951 RepID=A0A8C3TJE8_CATUS